MFGNFNWIWPTVDPKEENLFATDNGWQLEEGDDQDKELSVWAFLVWLDSWMVTGMVATGVTGMVATGVT
ncbi:hypothetical protein L3X38_037588 [Prunus dulcis]|uniref:Uncharacterized protein n=1 Tax=Prunus dulcis TaxID=3755 RepID=A0AAD4V5K0_PRUDU|nr:hypothetical protein L3X38_037588 [Prunus dulcis]